MMVTLQPVGPCLSATCAACERSHAGGMREPLLMAIAALIAKVTTKNHYRATSGRENHQMAIEKPDDHYCHAEGCEVIVPPKMHMCLVHWRMVPKAVQELIWKHYRPGQEMDKRPTIEYIATAFVSISCVALKEGKPLPSLGE